MDSLLDPSVEVRWNNAPRSWGSTPGPSTVSWMLFSQFTWVKKKKKTKRQGWVTILFLFHLVRLVGPS